MRKSLLSLISMTVIAACGDARRPGDLKVGGGGGANSGMTTEVYNRLIELNQMQQDNIDARNLAAEEFVPFAETKAFASEKARKMSESLDPKICAYKGTIPDDVVNGQFEQTVGAESGSNCPIFWSRLQAYNSASKVVAFADDLEIRSEDYRNRWSRFTARRLKGTFGYQPLGSGGRVTGVININEFQTLDHGPVRGEIKIDHVRRGETGAGSVAIALNGRGWSATGVVQWKLGEKTDEVTYLIGGRNAKREEFMNLFSAYSPDKFMANAIDMK